MEGSILYYYDDNTRCLFRCPEDNLAVCTREQASKQTTRDTYNTLGSRAIGYRNRNIFKNLHKLSGTAIHY